MQTQAMQSKLNNGMPNRSHKAHACNALSKPGIYTNFGFRVGTHVDMRRKFRNQFRVLKPPLEAQAKKIKILVSWVTGPTFSLRTFVEQDK